MIDDECRVLSVTLMCDDVWRRGLTFIFKRGHLRVTVTGSRYGEHVDNKKIYANMTTTVPVYSTPIVPYPVEPASTAFL